MEKLLPQNIDAERGVLGSILIDPEAIDRVTGFLRVDDFYRDAHRTVYETILKLADQKVAADFITLCDELERRNRLEDVGGASYLASLINDVPTSGNAVFYGRIVQRTGILRRLIAAAGRIAAIAYEADDASTALELAERIIFETSQPYLLSMTSDIGMSELMSLYMDLLETRYENRGRTVGIPTGYRDLDRLLGGLQRSDLDILAARTSLGKTAFAVNIAYNAAIKYKRHVGIFSLEMSKEQLAQRFVALDSGVEQQRLRTGLLRDEDWDPLVEAVGRLAELGIRIDDTAGISLLQMRSRARRWIVEYGIELLIVDYLQLVTAADNQKYENRQQEVSAITRGLKNLARELNVPVLALAQLSRALESRQSKIPQLSDLRECVIGSTRLIDAKTGKWIPIAQVKPGDEILGLGRHQKIGRFAVQDVWCTGKKLVYRLTTRTGRQLVATANHPLLLARGWKPLEELRVGERVATAMRLPEHGQELSQRAGLCRLLGYMVGDGTRESQKGIGFISSDAETVEDVINLVTVHFPEMTPHPHTCRGKAQEVSFSCVSTNGYGKPDGNPLREWLRSLDMVGQRETSTCVPDWVFEAGTSGACEFLAGYLSADGCVKRGIKRGHTVWEIHFDTVSRRLADDIQALLLRLGIVASVNGGAFHPRRTQPTYRVSISSYADNLERFAKQLPVRGKKGRLLQALLAELPPTHTGPGAFGLPRELSASLAQQTKRRDQGKCLRREVCLEWAEPLDDPQLREWGASDLFWEEIQSIEPYGEAEVFDVCIPGCSNFIANGIVAHNSGEIEQTSDVVMFIYRDEVYNPETERRNQADIIIAKQRNGPVGNVTLYFNQTQSRFQNLDTAFDPATGEIAFAAEDENDAQD